MILGKILVVKQNQGVLIDGRWLRGMRCVYMEPLRNRFDTTNGIDGWTCGLKKNNTCTPVLSTSTTSTKTNAELQRIPDKLQPDSWRGCSMHVSEGAVPGAQSVTANAERNCSVYTMN